MTGWDVLNSIVTSKAFIPSIIFVIGLVVVAIVGVKQGWFKFKGKGITIGEDENERRIIRQQIEYSEAACNALIRTLPIKEQNLDIYRTKYIIEKVFDELVKTISFNHISNDESYISVKQEVIYNLVLSRTEKDFFKTEDFKEYVFKWVKDIIKMLVSIREMNKR